MAATAESLQAFVDFCDQHISGDEKGEAQTFLDRFFRAFGHDGALEAGAEYEKRVKKGSKKGKTGFADLVWKPRVLVEMKKRGTDLSKHYSQAFDYWTRLVPDRPRFVLLCNFDEFWIYDFQTQLDTPVDEVPLADLPQQISAFGFMEKAQRVPIFRNNQVEVTERAACRMGELLYELETRGIDKLIAQRFILQCVLAMFAEDRGLLPPGMFIGCIKACLQGENSYDVLNALFQEMNRKGKTPAGRFKGVDYFNGGLFAEIHPIELDQQELKMLEVSALEDWSQVRPAIFGNLFESAIDEKERHAHGIHFTSEVDIMKIVRPTISRYWEEKIEAANTLKELNALRNELTAYKVLDPACGSGNFLYIAYQELKRIEFELTSKIAENFKSVGQQMQIGFVTPLQFHGIDNNPFAVELARVTLMIARKVAIDKFGLSEPALPLDTLDQNIVCEDALFTEWPRADAIIGNPPFLGGKHMRLVLGDDYIDSVFESFPEVKDSVDYCSYWFRLAQDQMQVGDRAGLVGTNSIGQGKSRLASLDYVVQSGGFIHEAISSQPWSGEANVHVSLVNWSLEKPSNFYLDDCKVSNINSSLQPNINVSGASRLKSNLNFCFQGVIPVGKGFLIDKSTVDKWIQADSLNAEVLKLFSMGSNLAKNPNGLPHRWIVDFNDLKLEDACSYALPFEHVKTHVKPSRENNRREVTRLNWWKHGEKRPAMRNAIEALTYCFAVPRVSKWAVFVQFPKNWLAGDKSVVLASDDFYVFGIVTSSVHRTWMYAQKSTLKSDIAYTHNMCFETFPFPQFPPQKVVEKIRQTAIYLHEYRSQEMEKRQWGITTLYNNFFDEPASQLSQLHAQLDTLVMQAYGFKDSDDILEKLLELNLELAEKEKKGEPVVGPWAPE